MAASSTWVETRRPLAISQENECHASEAHQPRHRPEQRQSPHRNSSRGLHNKGIRGPPSAWFGPPGLTPLGPKTAGFISPQTYGGFWIFALTKTSTQIAGAVIQRTHPLTEYDAKQATVSIPLMRRRRITLVSVVGTVVLAALVTSFFALPFRTPFFGTGHAVNPVTSTQQLGWGISGHPSTKSARYFFRVQNVSDSSVEIRDLGASVLNLRLVKPPNWSTPVVIAPGKSVPVAVVYRATSCRVMANVSSPMRMQVRSGDSSWRTIGITLAAVDGPGKWERSVLNAACRERVVVHGGFQAVRPSSLRKWL